MIQHPETPPSVQGGKGQSGFLYQNSPFLSYAVVPGLEGSPLTNLLGLATDAGCMGEDTHNGRLLHLCFASVGISLLAPDANREEVEKLYFTQNSSPPLQVT